MSCPTRSLVGTGTGAPAGAAPRPTLALLAGGLATRLRPITEKIPKSLVEVAGRPFLHHQLDLMRDWGITRCVICTGHLGERLREAVPDGGAWGIDLAYSFDGEPLLGTGGALRKALPLLSDPFLVLYGDSYLPIDLGPVLAALAPEAAGLMTVFPNAGRWDTSNVLFRDGRLLVYDKKNRLPEMAHIDYGLCLFRHAAFAGTPAGPFDLSQLQTRLVAEGRLSACEAPSRFYEIGSPAGLRETDRFLADRAASRGASRLPGDS